MQIHHSQQKKAQKMGIQLEPFGSMVRAIWPMRNITVFGVDARWAIEQMEATQRLVQLAEERGLNLWVKSSSLSPVQVHLAFEENDWSPDAKAPAVWWAERDSVFPASQEMLEQEAQKLGTLAFQEFIEDKPNTINRIPTDGAVAYHQGRTASECPFEEGTEEAALWNQQFDEEADKPIEAEPEEEPQPHSIVKSKYRAQYAEDGHPTTCGDELAEKLNSLLKNTGGTNVELLDEICRLNEISLEKYNRTKNGWQGRLRMTARNMLARKARENGGVLKLPEMLGGEFKLSSDWVGSSRT